MSSGGGSTVKQEIPKWVEDAAKANLSRGEYAASLGYAPYYGPDVAAFSPLQLQGMRATGMGAQAFGLAPQGFDATAGIPTPMTDSLGFSGYSSGNMFDDAMRRLQANRPAQYDAYQSMFIDPMTGSQKVVFGPEGSISGTNAGDAINGMVDHVGDSIYSDGVAAGAFDPSDPYAQAGLYNNAQKLRHAFKTNPLLNALPFGGLINLGTNAYLNSEAGINASQGGSLLNQVVDRSGGSSNHSDPFSYDSGYGVGSGLNQGSGISGVTSKADSSEWDGGYGYWD